MNTVPSNGIFDVYERIGYKWNSRVVLALGKKRIRFNDLKREFDGLSQRMLTRTLRSLERDGLVRRTVIQSLQSHVDYELTPLGLSAFQVIETVTAWIDRNSEHIRAAQAAFDLQHKDT
jgi:DNA-binding HxlR family transcriptional regulator